jgi:hypothetical protein
MSVTAETAQAVCQGCCLNPNWYFNPNWPFTNDPPPYQNNPSPFQQPTFSAPIFIDNLALAKLTPGEEELLKKLGEAFSLYTALDKRSEADNKEFTDAIHRAQQLVALRVARRVNPEVWAQPE